MHKQNAVYAHSEIPLGHKRKEILTHAATGMDLENIGLSEVNLTQKDRYYIFYFRRHLKQTDS